MAFGLTTCLAPLFSQGVLISPILWSIPSSVVSLLLSTYSLYSINKYWRQSDQTQQQPRKKEEGSIDCNQTVSTLFQIKPILSLTMCLVISNPQVPIWQHQPATQYSPTSTTTISLLLFSCQWFLPNLRHDICQLQSRQFFEGSWLWNIEVKQKMQFQLSLLQSRDNLTLVNKFKVQPGILSATLFSITESCHFYCRIIWKLENTIHLSFSF